MTPSDSIEVKRSAGRGRGVFARRPIEKGEVIETAPVMTVAIDDIEECEANPLLFRVFFTWGTNKLALALGYGSLYNHSYKPNAIYEYGHATIIFRALRPISKGEEICVNYNGDPAGKASVGFEVT